MTFEDYGIDKKITDIVKEKQKLVDAACLRYMEPYVPYQSGVLSKSATLHTVIGSGKIMQVTPYAHYLYYGEIYGPSIPIKSGGELIGFYSIPGVKKEPTGRPLTYDATKHPLAGKLWFERMKADHLDDIKREAGLK